VPRNIFSHCFEFGFHFSIELPTSMTNDAESQSSFTLLHHACFSCARCVPLTLTIIGTPWRR